MATQEKTWNVANRLHSMKDSDKPEVNHIIAGADEIYDDTKGAKQDDINAQTDAALADRYTKSETYSKEQLDALITTPDVEYVTVATFAGLPQTGEADTIYRVSSYDGSQVDASKYALYAWNGATYQLLAVRSAVGEVFDVSEYNSGATYETLTAALAAVPASVQRGGMSIKFILRTNTGTEEEPVYHDEYVQYLLKNTAWSITPSDWESTDGNNTIHINDAQQLTDAQKAKALANMGIGGIDDAPTANSDNLVRSGGVQNELALGAVYDVSAKNPTAGPNNDGKFESLSALLSDANLNTLIPTSVRKGGMSIKFVQSSDNKYVQHRLMKNTWSTNVSDWQGVDEEPKAGSNNLVQSGGTDNRINLLPLKTSPMCIQTNVWDARAPHWTIPVNGGETVEHLRSGSDNTIYYALLTEYSTPVAGQTPAFLTGYEGRRTTNRTFVIPSGCKYLVITYINDFSYIKINGYNILNGIWPIILKAIDSGNIADGAITSQKLNQAFLATLELIANKKGTIERWGSSNDYVNAVCLYRKFVNLDSALQGIDALNLFEISDYGFIQKSTGEPVTSPTSIYNLSAFIPVVQGHSYRYRLSGSSSAYIIAEYSSNQGTATGGVAGNDSVKSGVYVPESGVNYVRLSSGGKPFFADMTEHLFAFESEITDVTNALGALDQAAIKDSDLTIESERTNNMANPANIMTGMISNTGAIRTDVTTWEMIKVDVTPGTVVSFGGFNLGRNGYAAFYNANNEKQGSLITIYYSNGVQQPVENKEVPEGATLLYISIKSPDSPENPYSNLMVNLGAELLPYEPYSIEKITEIKGYEILGADSTLEDRVADLEEEVEELIEQGTTIPDLIADLPVSDGTDIASGYAYIDNTTYNVKVKQ